MKLEYLREFLVLAQCLNFSLAAEKLYITQSGLSRHISALERYFGVPFFLRTTQSVALTEEGRIFLEKAAAIVAELDALRGRFLRCDGAAEQSLRIGLPQFAMTDYLGALPRRFEQTHPEVRLSYFAGSPEQNLDALFRGDVDVILIAHVPFEGAEKLTFHDFYEEPLIVLMPDDHPLAGQKQITCSELAEDTFLCTEGNYHALLWAQVRAICQRSGFAPRGPILHAQLESVLVSLRQGAGITVVGEHLCSLGVHGLTYALLDGPDCFRTQSLAYLAGNHNPALPIFLKLFDQLWGNSWSR